MRRTYSAPHLSSYGDVRRLTQKAGSVHFNDAMSGDPNVLGDDSPQTVVTIGSHTFNRFLA